MQHAHFSTADLDLAATIMAAVGAKLLGLDRTDPDGVRFVFNADEVLEVVEAYWKGELRVEPVLFSTAVRSLRANVESDPLDEAAPNGLAMRSRTRRRTSPFECRLSFVADEDSLCESEPDAPTCQPNQPE